MIERSDRLENDFWFMTIWFFTWFTHVHETLHMETRTMFFSTLACYTKMRRQISNHNQCTESDSFSTSTFSFDPNADHLITINDAIDLGTTTFMKFNIWQHNGNFNNFTNTNPARYGRFPPPQALVNSTMSERISPS